MRGVTMKESAESDQSAHLPTRRQIVTRITAALSGMAAGPEIWGQTQPIKEAPSSTTKDPRTSLHQENAFKASARRIYDLLLDSKLFAAFTGMPAEIDPKAGGAFTTFG